MCINFFLTSGHNICQDEKVIIIFVLGSYNYLTNYVFTNLDSPTQFLQECVQDVCRMLL